MKLLLLQIISGRKNEFHKYANRVAVLKKDICEEVFGDGQASQGVS